MNFLEFAKIFGKNKVIDIRNVETYFDGLDRRRLYEWQKKGHIVRVANNYYLFSHQEINDQVLKVAASQIYKPSYIALESAMSYYGFIPEAVFQTISLTTRRNKVIHSKVGDFSYRSIKAALFFGYHLVSTGAGSYFISDTEKTLLDVLYFTPGSDQRNVLKEMRLNLEAIAQAIDLKKMNDYLKVFSSPKLDRAMAELEEMIHAEF